MTKNSMQSYRRISSVTYSIPGPYLLIVCVVIVGFVMASSVSAQGWTVRSVKKPDHANRSGKSMTVINGTVSGDTDSTAVVEKSGGKSLQLPDQQPELPSRAEIKRTVDEYFTAELPKIGDPDIVSRNDFQQMINDDKEMIAWLDPQQQKAIQAKLLPAGDYLVKKLRTPRGRIFCKKIGANPAGYDRIDRLRAGGQASELWISRIIDSPSGEKWINQLKSPKDPAGNWTAQFINQSGIPNSRNFTKSTSRIYTKRMLIDALSDARDEIGKEQQGQKR